MRYLYAILSTILLVLVPLIIIPSLDWYCIKFNVHPNSLIGVYFIMMLLTIGAIVLVVARWVSAIRDKSFKELFE